MAYPAGPPAGGGGIDVGRILRENAPLILMLVIVLVLAGVIGTIFLGVGAYVLGVFNSSNIVIPSQYNLLKSIPSTASSLITILGAMCIIGVVVVMLILLIQTARAATGLAGLM